MQQKQGTIFINCKPPGVSSLAHVPIPSPATHPYAPPQLLSPQLKTQTKWLLILSPSQRQQSHHWHRILRSPFSANTGSWEEVADVDHNYSRQGRQHSIAPLMLSMGSNQC